MSPPWGGYPPQYGGYPGYAAPAPRTDGTATAALILAIASFVVCPVIPAVISLVLIPSSRRNIAASGGAVGGEGLLAAAKIVSLINLGLAAVALVAFIIVIIVAASSTSTSTTTGFQLLSSW